MAVRKMFSDISTSTTTPETIFIFQTKLGHVVLNKATEFVVIEDFGCSPAADWSLGLATGGIDNFMNIRINTTAYFTEPDGSPSLGVRGLLSPYPDSTVITKNWDFNPRVYILPGQTWDMVFSHGTLTYGDGALAQLLGMVVWTLYDGVDCVIANKLVEMGISVVVDNIDWYKRELIKQKEAR